ncbi:MAG: type I restriction enzyme HsdR N-terminal domain-containing protein [Flavobacteriales bacterium]|nr:type I restriction enzyme HsdR N-terminal domain-containing protein [Flavobacteriales bacterium]
MPSHIDSTSSFPKLTLPLADLKLRTQGGLTEVQCLSRGKYVRLEPEEWVRQHWLSYLHRQLGYPIGVIAAEYPLILNGMKRRADIVCHDPNGKPLVMIECKRPAIKLNQAALDQVLRYNISLQIPCLIVSNGLRHHAYSWKNNQLEPLDQVPPYSAF